jgi:hypothetical protein
MRTSNTERLRHEVKCHIATDAIIQGTYWNGSRGCFIGCLSHSKNPLPLAELYGLPVTLVRLAESVFERLPASDAKQFFADFPEAVATDGKDLNLVVWRFLASELRSLPPTDLATQAAIDLVIAGMDLLASGQPWPAAAKAAANNAVAANAARLGVGVAAEWAAIAGAKAAVGDWAAGVARQRDLLLRLIREAPVVQP